MTKKKVPRSAAKEDGAIQIADYFSKALESLKPGGVDEYSKTMSTGVFRACKRSFGGKVFEQLELDTPKATAIASLLIESDIFASVGMQGDELNIDAGAIISHLVKKGMMNAMLSIILTKEDGSICTDEDFNGKFSEYMQFCMAVITDFFTLNRESLPTIGILLMSGLGISTMGGQFVASLLAGMKRFGLSVKDGPKATS